MKRSTVTLTAGASGLYYLILFLLRSFITPEFEPPLYFLVIPLLVIVLILASDLSFRATVPTEPRVTNPPSRKLAREVQDLSRKIEVGGKASQAYFETALLARLRDILLEKAALEMGLDLERARELLSNPRLGPGLLRNNRLYALLYSPVRAKGAARVKMIEDAVGMIEAWKS